MGSQFRSQEMTLCQLFLQTEAAYACVSELGELGLVQFRDLKPDTNAFQRKFVNEIRRCDEMERKLRYLEKEIKRDAIPVLDTGDNPEAPAPREMIDLEATLEKLENELREVNDYAENLKKNFLELTELKHILRKTQTFFEEGLDYPSHRMQALHDQHMTEEAVGLMSEEGMMAGGQAAGLRLQSVAGVILRERLPAFERMLWRVCRGNVFLKQAEIDTPLEDPVSGDQVLKSVFIIFFQGEQLKTRVKKICEGFRATLYPCPDSQAERREMAISVMTRIEDLNTVLNTTVDHRMRVLMAAAKNLRLWFIKVSKIKAIYHSMNLFNVDVTNKCLIGEAWCAVDDLDKIHLALRRGTERSGSTVPPILNRMTTNEQPPTYFRTNKFTSGFQNIIDAFGVASYREANPAPFTIITFPFLFAVMFGDFGHGFLMFLFALWMVLREQQLQSTTKISEIWATFFGGRYIILLMGAFSIYTGLIYNDIFSKSVDIFGTSWSVKAMFPDKDAAQFLELIRTTPSVQLNPNRTKVNAFNGNPYPFGLDPIWQLSENKIAFTNSIKMKASVVLGVFHMVFGVSVSLTNHLHRKDYLSVFCEFIPQIIFLVGMFGYLVILIIYKWLAYSGSESNCAPSLLIGLINMFLFKSDAPLPNCTALYTGIVTIQYILVILIALCVPWMLLVKPIILVQRHKKQKMMQQLHNQDSSAYTDGNNFDKGADGEVQSTGDHGQDHGHVEEFEPVEVFVHQTIHTIEYCLGCISNTASYLRLWALSLAHGQLSEVLWDMVLRLGLERGGWEGAPMVFAVFAVWAVLTVCVLLLMEGLSAFLHALRLHWVEFMNKFYHGDGYMFEPFTFERADLDI